MIVTVNDLAAAHPSWCDRVDCAAVRPGERGSHAAKASVLEPDRYEAIGARVRVVQDTPVRDYPYSDLVLVELRLDFVTYEDGAEEPVIVVLRGDRARALGRLLVSAGRKATR